MSRAESSVITLRARLLISSQTWRQKFIDVGERKSSTLTELPGLRVKNDYPYVNIQKGSCEFQEPGVCPARGGGAPQWRRSADPLVGSSGETPTPTSCYFRSYDTN